jgi:hypothetical protein
MAVSLNREAAKVFVFIISITLTLSQLNSIILS